jgi:hypothetical protein
MPSPIDRRVRRIANHDYVQGVRTKAGSDGRRYTLCALCDMPKNAQRHHGGATQTVPEAHTFRPGDTAPHGPKARLYTLCRTCGQPKNVYRHRDVAIAAQRSRDARPQLLETVALFPILDARAEAEATD